MEILIAILLLLLALAKVLARRSKMHRVIFEDGSRGYIRTSELIDALDKYKQ